MPLTREETAEMNQLSMEVEEADIDRQIAQLESRTTGGDVSQFDFSALPSLAPRFPAEKAPSEGLFGQFTDLIGQPTQPGSPADLINQIDKFIGSKPSQNQDIGTVLNLIKEVGRLPKDLIDPIITPLGEAVTEGKPAKLGEAGIGVLRTIEGLARFFPDVARNVINVTGAGIPTPPLIGEQPTEETFRRPTSREALRELSDRPLGVVLGALGLGKLGKAKPVEPPIPSRAFKKAVPLAEVSKGVVKAQVARPSILAEKAPEIEVIPDKAVKLQLPKEKVPEIKPPVEVPVKKVVKKPAELEQKGVTDVTPEGFGPRPLEKGEKAFDPKLIRGQITLEQGRLINSINEGNTILSGKISAEKHIPIKKAIAHSRKKLEASLTSDQKTLEFVEPNSIIPKISALEQTKKTPQIKAKAIADKGLSALEQKDLKQPTPTLPKAEKVVPVAPVKAPEVVKPTVTTPKQAISEIIEGKRESKIGIKQYKSVSEFIRNELPESARGIDPNLYKKTKSYSRKDVLGVVKHIELIGKSPSTADIIYKGINLGLVPTKYAGGGKIPKSSLVVRLEKKLIDYYNKQKEGLESGQVKFKPTPKAPPTELGAFGAPETFKALGETAKKIKDKLTKRSTQDIVPETPRISRIKAADFVEKSSIYATAKEKTDLYPLVKESQVRISKGKDGIEVRRFKPATDAQLQAYTQMTPELWDKLKKNEKADVRKAYSRQRRLQLNEQKLDNQLRKEFGIEPDVALRKKLADKPPEFDLKDAKRDINTIEKTIIPLDPTRMFERILPDKVAKTIIDKRDVAKAEYTEYVLDKHKQHVTDVEKGIGIKPGSRLELDIKAFGEGDMSLQQITKKHGAKGAEKIVKAAEWYRARYEELLLEYNSTTASLYPGKRSKLARRRKDYFHHMTELGDMSRLLDIVEEPGGLLNAPTNVLNFLKPEGKKPGFIRRRLGRKSDRSAAAGYASYIQQVGYGVKINPMVKYMRQFANQMDKAALEGKGEIPRFRTEFQNYVNGLSGIPNAIDAWMSEHLGKGWDVMQLANRRAKQNIILGNLGTLVAQPFNLQNALAEMGSTYMAKGISKSVADIFLKKRRNHPMMKSPFMRERYLDSHFSKYKFGMINKGKSSAAWAMRTMDKLPAIMMWNGFFEKALSEGMTKSKAIRFADLKTRKAVAGRGIGELPNLQRSKVFQMLAPFTVEVGNAAWAFVDLKNGQRKFSKYATFVIASYIMNRIAEEIRGNAVSFDPLGALSEGIQASMDENRSTGERIAAIPGRLAGEVISAIPIGQALGHLYPLYGAKIPGTDIKLPTRKQVFGSNDPTRFGSTILVYDALFDWRRKLLLPFGGVQAKKTITGIRALREKEIRFGRKTIPIKRSDVNILKAPLFGPFSTEEAQQFFDRK